ncbi:MAG: ribonuclease R [Lachnospiraceae bacterium]|nr:ribonuclease R [Lachnospiraceae bacterium]
MNKELFEKRKKVIYDLVCDKHYVPMKAKELAMLLQVPKDEREALSEALDALVLEGKITCTKNGKYQKASENLLTGIFEAAANKPFGFVRVEGRQEDIYIHENNVNGAFNKDTVQVRITAQAQDGRREEGEIVNILARGFTEIVGTFKKDKNFGFVIPDNQKFAKDVFVPVERSKGAVTGHKVVVKLTSYGNKNKNPEGIVTEIIGHINDPGTDILSIIKAHGIPMEFPKEVMKQVESIPEVVLEEEKVGRKDLRDVVMVTIDGEDAKDLDDAVSLEKKGDRYYLGVHIADVTHYVREGSALDNEALKRGTSVYLVDRVIPMLPHKLSNGICSLNAGVDRLALSCLMEIDSKGNVVGHEIAETLIHIDRRMSYTSVKKILEDNDEQEKAEYKELVPMFELMAELASILRSKRRKRGSIDFDFPETKIILDDKGHPVEIKPYERNTATKIIEDFMLITNETIAEDYFWQEMPFVYRTHETPDPEKIQKLEIFINNFGYGMKGSTEEIHPKELQKLLERIENTPEEALISRLTLRSMKQARYTTACSGHFGLSAKYYCHFTSPIRRYPDLQIHRIIKENLNGNLGEKRMSHYNGILNEVAEHASKTERRADEAERDTEKLKKVEFIEDYIGEVFEGVISGITNYGIYMELENTIEGMIHVNNLLDDYYYYDEEKYEMVGKDTGRTFKLGEKLLIQVAGCDKITRTIDFILAEEDGEEEF